MIEIKLKPKVVSLKDFYTSYILLTTYLPKKYAEVLSILMLNYPKSVVDNDIKLQIKQVLKITKRKTEYQDQTVSKSLTYLSEKGFIIKVQNGVYEMSEGVKYIVKKVLKEKNDAKININFPFQLNEL